MKALAKIGFSISAISLLFGLYLMLVVVPEAKDAEVEWNIILLNNTDVSKSLSEVPGYSEALVKKDKDIEYGSILLLVSIVPFLMCLYPAIKKNKLAILGLVFFLGAFFIAAVYGTHMFS